MGNITISALERSIRDPPFLHSCFRRMRETKMQCLRPARCIYAALFSFREGVNTRGVRLSPCRRRWRRRREGSVITHARIPRHSRPRPRNRLTDILTVRRPASSATRCISILVVHGADHSHSRLFVRGFARAIYLTHHEEDASDAPLKRARLTAPLAEPGQSIESERVFVRVQSVPS